jgi:hypothetical protein
MRYVNTGKPVSRHRSSCRLYPASVKERCLSQRVGLFTPMIWFTALCLAVVGSARAAIEQAEVTGGTVQGTVDHGVAAFKGLPFAAPPVGDLRWKAPQPVIPWTGVKQTRAALRPGLRRSGRLERRLPLSECLDCGSLARRNASGHGVDPWRWF